VILGFWGGFACTSWAENKEAVSRSAKESIGEFFHQYHIWLSQD
jgi:hypothetical protein